MKHDMRFLLRRLYENDPESFKEAISEIQRMGDGWYRQPFEIVNGKPAKVNDKTLAMLLADYRNAQAAGITRDEFLERLAADGCSYGNFFYEGQWNNAETIRTHLKDAEAKSKASASFAAEVDFYQSIFIDLRISAVGWIEPG